MSHFCESFPVFLESYSFLFKTQPADSEVGSSLKLRFLLRNLFQLVFFVVVVEKLIWISGEFKLKK